MGFNDLRNRAASLGLSRGKSLGAAIDRLAESKASSGNMTKEDVYAAAGSRAGISSSTVKQIVNGQIVCPPRDRLEGLARYFGVSVDSLVSSARKDGCEYE